jgi:hypothetical protein
MRPHLQIAPGADHGRTEAPGPVPRPTAFSRNGVKTMIKIVIFVAVWFIIMRFILPRFGVPT